MSKKKKKRKKKKDFIESPIVWFTSNISHVIGIMSNFSSQDLIERSGKRQKYNFATAGKHQYFLIII